MAEEWRDIEPFVSTAWQLLCNYNSRMPLFSDVIRGGKRREHARRATRRANYNPCLSILISNKPSLLIVFYSHLDVFLRNHIKRNDGKDSTRTANTVCATVSKKRWLSDTQASARRAVTLTTYCRTAPIAAPDKSKM